MGLRHEEDGSTANSGTRTNDTSGVPNERTALVSPDSARHPQYATTAAETQHNDSSATEDSYSADEEMDSNEADWLIARTASFTPAAGLAPEPLESSMLRGRELIHGHHRHHRRASTQAPKIKRSSALVTEEEIEDNSDPEATADDDDVDAKKSFIIDTDPSRFWRIFMGILMTYFIACFDGTIMASSHPVVASYFHAANSASWMSTAFLLTSLAFQPMLGRLSDSLGRKMPTLVAMAIFALGNLWCALATSVTGFILARAVCGAGAGGMMSLATMIVSDIVDIERRGTYQGILNIMYGVSSAAGAALGGIMADKLGWRWEFGVQVPALVFLFAFTATSIPDDLGLKGKRGTFREAMEIFDFKGTILLATSTTFLILGLNLGGNVISWSHPFTIASLIIFAICFPVFLYVESLAKKPIMPLELLTGSPRANIIFSNFIACILLNAILFNAPLFFQAVLVTTATESGLFLIVPTLTASVVGTIISFTIAYNKRVRWPILSGVTFYVIGTALLATMQRDWPTWAYLLCLVPGAMAQGFQFPATSLAVLAASEQTDQAVVTATLVAWRGIGNVLGVASSSLVVQNALAWYLQLYVTAGDRGQAWKDELIERVRSSVEVVPLLAGEVREQVVRSYAAALRLTFLCLVLLAVVSFLLVVKTKLPRFAAHKK